MKVQTNAGEVELTAEMVVRGMVFEDADVMLTVLRRWDSVTGWWETTRPGGSPYREPAGSLAALRLLGCDPAIATRADCERFGVHGDAAAHGFARLRDGGAVDLRKKELPPGSVVGMPIGGRAPPGAGPPLLDNERFVGLDACRARPEDVLRMCCGAPLAGNADSVVRCTLAIGDHEQHEDLATGVKWAAKSREDFNANLRAAAAIAEPREWTAEDIQRRVAETFAASAVAGWKVAQESVTKFAQALGACPNCGGDDATCRGSLAGLKTCAAKGAQMADHSLSDADIGVMVREDGYEVAVKRDFGGVLRVTVYGATAAYCRSLSARIQDRIPSDIMLSVESGWGGVEVASGKALDRLALLYDEERHVGETCEDLRARLRRIHARGPGFRVGVDPARPDATAFVSAAMRKAGEPLAAVGEAAKRCAESVMLGSDPAFPRTAAYASALGFCRFVDGLKRWAALCSCGALGPDTADNLHAQGCRTVRARREAPLVSLVAAVPEGLDPIGWRAAVLAVHECATSKKWDVHDLFYVHAISWALSARFAYGTIPDAGESSQVVTLAVAAYQRAITQAPKVDRVRATWKTRGPVLPCDNGEDE